jgi:hypothetical protein
MVLPDLLEVQSDCSFCIDHGVSGNEICSFSDTVDDYHDCIIAMHMRKLNNEVNANDVPLVCWSLCRVKLSIGSMVLQLCLIA